MPEMQPGQILTHYRLVEKLGEGGMGVVWKAFDTRLGRHIALKVLRPELISDPERQRRFMREARAAAAVSHPTIVTIYEVDEVDGTSFLCMELVEGRTLRAALAERRPLPIMESLRIAADIAEGLARAHRDGIVHRDLKPENVILAMNGRPKILDFGLAKLIEFQQEGLRSGMTRETVSAELTATGIIMGTAAYMSPEQARGEVVDGRSDIFSFGIMLYEVVTGRRPFAGSSQIATLAAILHEAAVPATSVNPEVPAQVEKLLNKCLEKEPDRRYQSSEDLATDLRRLLRDLEPARQSAQARTELAPAVSQRPSIAVLPFQNMSTESAHSFFAGGLHDELLTQLAKVAGLKVISRTSVMGYKDTTKPLKVIGQELGVKTIVEGSVQVLGGRLRVNVQLIDAATDEHLWAERYDRTLDDAFAIQSDMAQQVVAAVGAALGADERREIAAAPTEDPEAYHLYIQGDSYRQRPGFQRQNFEVAQQLYERALARDPKFALAHAALSETHGHLYFQRFDPTAGRAARQREEAQKALCLAPDLPQAHAAMGRVYYWGEQDYGKALQEFEIALRGMPNDAELWNTIGAVHRRLGDWDAVRAAFDRAVQLNPRSADVLGALGGMTFTFLRQYSEALRAYDRSIALTSGWADSWAWDKAWALVLWKGDLDALKSFLAHVHTDEELGGLGTARRTRAELLLLERRAEALLELVRNAPDAAFRGQMFYTPTSLYSAWGHELRDDVGAAQTEYGAALDLLDSASGEFADDWRIHDARGLALAGLGRSHDALSEVQWLRGTHTYRFDAFSGPEIRARIALILVRAGESEGGLDEIERDLAGPGWLSAPLLRLDPRWDPVREHPRFKALLVKYADPEIPAAR